MIKLFLLILVFTTPSCLNTGTQGKRSTSSTTAGSGGAGTTTSRGGPSFSLVSGVLNPPPSTSSSSSQQQVPVMTLIFNASNTTHTLNDFCQVQNANTSGGGGSSGGSSGSNDNVDQGKSCKCHYEWAESNLSDSSVITRIVQTNPTQITSFQVQCPVPPVYDSEIADGTILKIQLVPNTATGNNSGFTTNTLSYVKRPLNFTADFRDSEGRGYKNVYHYSCYDKPTKSLGIAHTMKTPFGNTTNVVPVLRPVANHFEVSGASAFSAQSYYYDFYVRSHEIGSVNAEGGGYTCPRVSISGTPSFYPMDSTIALALNASRDFPVRIEAQTFVQIEGGQSPGRLLGFAARPNADGSCPAFIDAAGRRRRTFRLRQYTSTYPLRFDADGEPKDKSQRINTVFIIDRPVDRTGGDPLAPITRLGPKPCPFSYRTAQFGQMCMMSATLAGQSIDGTRIIGDPACPIYPPPPDRYMSSDGTLVIRPYRPFLPYFLENTNFRACAFPSSTPVDPEILLSHDDTAFPSPVGPFDFYCSRHYPPAGAIIPPPNGDPFDKPPGDCGDAETASAIKTNRVYACSVAYNPTGMTRNTPTAGCCQICSGGDCTAQGGGSTAAGRNAAFSPPSDGGNPPIGIRRLPRAIPNQSSGGGCFDPFE